MTNHIEDASGEFTIETDGGFQLRAVQFEPQAQANGGKTISQSNFSASEAIQYAQLVELSDGEGTILYYPKQAQFEVGDVLFLRERPESTSGTEQAGSSQPSENGVIVQIISSGTANYPQASTKALFRLMANVRASLIDRSYNEPAEVIDEFLAARFKVRASIVDGEWKPPEGRVVTRNVDIFILKPEILTHHILEKLDAEALNIKLGKYKTEEVEFFGGGFEKINLITGMKGGGKSHIAKGIISESLTADMSAIVFDINNEYRGLPRSFPFIPGQNLRFRLDRIQTTTFLNLIDKLAPMGEKTTYQVRAQLPGIIRARADEDDHVPDLDYLIQLANTVIPRGGEPGEHMRASYRASLNVVKSYGLIMTEQEALAEDSYIKSDRENASAPEMLSLATALYNLDHPGEAGVIIFEIGGFPKGVQYVIVELIIDTLKEICQRQFRAYQNDRTTVPNYPTIYFEEAHMYMDPRVIDELLPLIRHFGMNVFFITNTPGALPDSVFRLLDSLIMTRMLNKKDIDQVKNCGLTDGDTIEGFASNLKEHHALFLSGIGGATNNFPLAFKVSKFEELPTSGETRSMWEVLKENIHTKQVDEAE